MSLAVLANHMASKGRNGDTMLVHMAPSEVAGLQALGLSHGISMTVNPHTGLPEAFSFKSLLKSALPMIAGFALGPAGFGLVSSSLGAAAIVGGATGLATGSLQKGIMAGLGAYGGASLGNALAGTGSLAMNQAAVDATLAANPGLTAGEIAREMGQAGFTAPQIAASANPATAGVFDRLGAGIKALGTTEGRADFMKEIGGGSGLMKAGYAAAAPIMADQATQTTTPMPGGQGYTGTIRPYRFDPYTKRWTAQPTYPATPVNTAPAPTQQEPGGMATGGIVALAAGGTPDLSGLSVAQRSYAEDLLKRSGQGTPDEILKYVGGLNDAQARASLASVQGAPIGGAVGVDPTQQAVPTTAQLAAQQSIVNDPQAAALAAARSGIAANMTDQQIADMVNMQYGKSFNAQNVADFIKANNLRPTTPAPSVVPESVVPEPTGTGTTYGGIDTLERVTPAPLGTPGKVTQENLTMDQVRDIYEKGGGATEMPTVTRLGPNERPMTQNAVVSDLQNYLATNPNATSTEITAWGRANGVPDYQLRAAINERRFNMLTGGSRNAYDYLMGRGAYPTTPFVPGGGPIMRPYSEVVGGESAIRRYVPPKPTSQTAQSAVTTTTGGASTSAKWQNVNTGEVKFAAPDTYLNDPSWRRLDEEPVKQAGGGLSSIAAAGAANGGQFNLGGYSDGGRLLRGPGDGVSDSIPATIGDKQPARLADGEFVVPARIVSEIGNGSTEAGARKLYAMMDRVQRARAKTTGKGRVAKDTKAEKYLPA
jgi:hypothetical protein